MKLLRWLLLLLAIANATVVSAQTKLQNEHSPIVFTHVAVLDTANASLQQDMTVVIVGDRIAEVGKAARVKVPKAAQVINGRGKFLMPGLWDMHVHTFRHNPRSTNTWYFPLFIANGITGIRDMWTTGDDFPQVVQFRKGLASGTFLGPRYGAVGCMVDGPDPIWPNSDVVSTPQQARDFVHKVKAAGIDFVKVYTRLRPEEYFAIVDEAKKVGIPFAGHVPNVISAAAASDAGQRSMEHLRNVDVGCSTKEQELLQAKTWGPQQRKEMLDTYDQQKCEQLLQRFARNQTWQVPTSWMFLQDRSRLRELLTTDPKSKYLPADVRALWHQQLPRLETSPQQNEERQKDQRQRLMIIAMMNKARVPMMAGTDVGNPFLFPGFSLHDELAAFVRAGLTPGEALKTATYNPAKYLGMLDRIGTIEKSKFADLVLLDANPLDDIRNTRRIRAVVVNGRYLDRTALDKLLAAAESAGLTRATAVAPEPVFLKRSVTVGKNIYGYRVYMPENFDAKKAYPVVLILHGVGARGDDNDRQTFSPVGSAIRRNPRQFDAFIAVFPQARENTYWIGEMVDQAVKALEQTVDEFKADPRRLYLTGNSLGGYGAWYTVAKYPGKFAALVPVSGGIFLRDAKTIAPEIRPLVPADMLKLYDAEDPYLAFAKMIGKTPTWIFHGSEDQTVPVSEARNMAQALRTVKGDVRVTEYAGEGHGVGAKPYADAELWKWLLAQRLDN